MAASLLALLDDIASILDDVSVLTKVAAKKTAGVLGDDLALNAQQVTGVRADRELPVVWAVAKGSLVKKAILVPAALAVSAVAPWAVTPLLMLGGAYLSFEGVEKLIEAITPHDEAPDHPIATESPDIEKQMVSGAVRTDFILSAEIMAIALAQVADQPLLTQGLALAVVAVAITAGVYGAVGLIVKMDDIGLHLARRGGGAIAAFGRGLVHAMPVVMRALSVIGVAAMLAFIPLTHSSFWGPLAYVLIGGVGVGTLLTLLFLPALYSLWFKVRKPSANAPLVKHSDSKEFA